MYKRQAKAGTILASPGVQGYQTIESDGPSFPARRRNLQGKEPLKGRVTRGQSLVVIWKERVDSASFQVRGKTRPDETRRQESQLAGEKKGRTRPIVQSRPCSCLQPASIQPTTYLQILLLLPQSSLTQRLGPTIPSHPTILDLYSTNDVDLGFFFPFGFSSLSSSFSFLSHPLSLSSERLPHGARFTSSLRSIRLSCSRYRRALGRFLFSLSFFSPRSPSFVSPTIDVPIRHAIP